MEIRVTRPFIVFFIPGDQYGGPDCFISCLHVLFTEINQIKSNCTTAKTCVTVFKIKEHSYSYLIHVIRGQQTITTKSEYQKNSMT